MTIKTKYIILLGDGMADWPIDSMQGKTPLETAHIPAMDFIAQNGQCGMVQTVPNGYTPGSDVANMSILGYDPAKYYTGRGPIEAVSMGIQLNPTELAFRCNLVTIENGVMKDFTAGHISTEEAQSLLQELNAHFQPQGIQFHAGVSYRHIAVLNERYQSIASTPPHDITDKTIAEYLPTGPHAAELIKIMESASQILAASEINRNRLANGKSAATHIWLWSQGKQPALPSFQHYRHLTGGIVTAVGLLKGIGQLIGFETPTVPGATGFIDTNYAGKVSAAIQLLDQKEFVYLHVEAPDEAGHMGDSKLKVKAIEDFNNQIVTPILAYQKDHPNVRILMLPDHPTPCQLKTHVLESVPFAIYYPGISPKPATAYSEKAADQTQFTYSSAPDLLDYFLNLP